MRRWIPTLLVGAGATAGADLARAETSFGDRRPQIEVTADPPGRELGSFRMTYYWATVERPGERATQTLRDRQCRPIARVSRRFARRLTMEGTGVLEDGRVINIAGPCRCARRCYSVNSDDQRWGTGVANRPLAPFRSVAVDRTRIPIGTWLYLPELDGVRMPGLRPWGGFVHDGCVVADDVGGGVRGRKIDFFAARRAYYRALAGKLGGSRVRVHEGGARCADHRRPQPAPPLG
jgi:3D (Asp-Asp-Asp) domain-containing protein